MTTEATAIMTLPKATTSIKAIKAKAKAMMATAIKAKAIKAKAIKAKAIKAMAIKAKAIKAMAKMATASAKKAMAKMATALTTKRPTARATMTANVHQLLMKSMTGVQLLLMPQFSQRNVTLLLCSATTSASPPRHPDQLLLPTSLATKEQKTLLALKVTYETDTRP